MPLLEYKKMVYTQKRNRKKNSEKERCLEAKKSYAVLWKKGAAQFLWNVWEILGCLLNYLDIPKKHMGTSKKNMFAGFSRKVEEQMQRFNRIHE